VRLDTATFHQSSLSTVEDRPTGLKRSMSKVRHEIANVKISRRRACSRIAAQELASASGRIRNERNCIIEGETRADDPAGFWSSLIFEWSGVR